MQKHKTISHDSFVQTSTLLKNKTAFKTKSRTETLLKSKTLNKALSKATALVKLKSKLTTKSETSLLTSRNNYKHFFKEN